MMINTGFHHKWADCDDYFAYGCGINESVRRLRIQRAIRLLTTTRLTNNQICQQIGIADYNYFFRVFRRQTGFTPQAYRRQFSGTD